MTTMCFNIEFSTILNHLYLWFKIREWRVKIGEWKNQRKERKKRVIFLFVCIKGVFGGEIKGVFGGRMDLSEWKRMNLE